MPSFLGTRKLRTLSSDLVVERYRVREWSKDLEEEYETFVVRTSE